MGAWFPFLSGYLTDGLLIMLGTLSFTTSFPQKIGVLEQMAIMFL